MKIVHVGGCVFVDFLRMYWILVGESLACGW